MPFDNPPQAPIGDVAILMDARSRIADPSRWLQYSFQDGDRHCLVAALSLACGSPSFDIPNETERRLAKHLAKQMIAGPRHQQMGNFRQSKAWVDDVQRSFSDTPR